MDPSFPRRRASRFRGYAFAAGAVALISAALFRFNTPGPVVGKGGLDRALAESAPAEPFENDGIRFLEHRLQSRKGDDPLARSQLARLYLSRSKTTNNASDLAEAISAYQRLSRMDPARAEVHWGLSACFLSAHRFQDALASAREGMRLAGADQKPAARLVYFDALFATGRYREAELQLDSASLQGGDAGISVRKSRLQAWKGSYASARSELEAAYSDALAGSAPPSVLAWFLTESGILQERMGNPSSALRLFLEALDGSPRYQPALEGIAALAHAWDGDLEGADRLLESSYRNGGHSGVLLDRMRIHLEMGHEGTADSLKAAYFAEAKGDSLSERRNLRSLALALSLTDSSREDALWYAELDLKERPTQEGYDCLAWVFYLRGSIAVAYHYSLLAMKAEGREPGLLCRAALIAWHAGRKAEAASHLEAALKGSEGRFTWKRKRPISGMGKDEIPNRSGRVLELLTAHSH